MNHSTSKNESNPIVPIISFEQKEEQEARFREQLIDDLLNQRLVYSSWPYEAHVQFSNFCNMSCIMCWDGRNPPTEKASPELLEKIDQQVAPHLSVITPYSGSEPLVLSWEETRQMAARNSVLLCITTNGQYLDEKRFHELKDITETLLVSIDSHIPEIMEIIRPGGNIGKVFDNLATAAKLSKQHGVECIVNVVLMTHNAPHLSQTIEWLADLGIESVNVIQLLDVNGRSSDYDPLLHFSREYISGVRKRCLKSAEAKNIRLIWSVSGCFEHDFRPQDHVKPLARKSWNDAVDDRMRRLFPGFCRNVFNRLRIDRHGDVAPCCYATQGELSLGNLNESDFEDIWNGPTAQDLRRSMLTGDFPSLCSSCRYVDPIPPQHDMEFLELIDNELAKEFPHRTIATDLLSETPDHGKRWSSAAQLCILKPEVDVREVRLALSWGGESEEIHRFTIDTKAGDMKKDGDAFRFSVPDKLWAALRTNVGYWWNAWAIPESKNQNIQRLAFSPVLIRQLDIERVSGSQLNYPNKGELPIIDLGVSKEPGWATPEITPARPEVQRVNAQPSVESKSLSASGTGELSGIWSRLVRSFSRQTSSADVTANPNWTVDGYLDRVVEEADYLYVTGWLMFVGGPADSIEFVSEHGKSAAARRVIRPDLEISLSKYPYPDQAGFEAKLRKSDFVTEFGHEFEIAATRSGIVVTTIRVRRFSTKANINKTGPFWIGKQTDIRLG